MATRSIKKTAGAVGRVMIATVAIIVYSNLTVSAGTSSRTDPMRCEALRLKCDSRYHMCLSRCDGIADRRALRSAEDGEDMRTNCSNACEVRHYNMEQRLEQRPVCSNPEPETPTPANPQACAAKLLWGKATYMQCLGRCHARFDQRPAFDCDGCVSRCYDEYRGEIEDTNAEPICSKGPAESVPVEAEPSSCTATN